MPSSTCRPGREDVAGYFDQGPALSRERGPSKGWLLVIPVLTALAQAGCAPDSHSYRPLDIGRVVSDGNSVTIIHASSEADARPLAEGYCWKFDKAARFERMTLFRAAHARFSSSSAVFMCETQSGRESTASSP